MLLTVLGLSFAASVWKEKSTGAEDEHSACSGEEAGSAPC